MASRSPARYTFVDDNIGESSMLESDLTKFDGGLPKSPMRERFLNDLGSGPSARTRSRDVSMSPMRESGAGVFYYDRVGKSPARQINFSKSPVRESETSARPAIANDVGFDSPIRENDLTEFDGGFPKSPMRERFLSDLGSVPNSPLRSKDVNRSPMRERVQGDFDSDGIGKSPVRQRNASQLPIRESKTQMSVRSRNVSSDVHEESEDRKLTLKSSFNAWLTDDEHSGQTNDNRSGSRRTWRDQNGFGVDPRKKSLYQDSGGEDGGYMTSRKTIDQSDARRDRVEHGRISASSGSNGERASSYRPNSISSYGEPRYSIENLRGPSSVRDLEMERAELLQRYKELSEQLGDLDDTRIPSTGLYEPVRGVRRPVSNMADVYDTHPHLYDYRSSGQMTRRPHPRQAHQLSKYTPGSVGGRFDQDSLESYFNDTHYHHPSCSCSHCYTDLVGNSRSSHSMNMGRYDPRVYNSRMAHTSPLERSSHRAYHHPRRHQLANMNKPLFLPIGGGAPFILCHNCLRLLKLPRKSTAKWKNQYQVQCGVCSAVMSFDLKNKSLSLLSAQKNQESNEADSGLVKILKESSLDHQRVSCDATSTNVESCEFDVVGTSLESTESDPSELSKAHKLSANVADNKKLLSPSSSHSSKEDQILDNPNLRNSLPYSTEMLLMMNSIPPPPGSPLRDLLDYSTYFHKVQAGEVKNNTEKETEEIEKDPSVESPTEDTTVAVEEMDVHSQEIPTTSSSHESEDIPRPIGESMSSESAEVYVNGQHIPQHLVKKAEKFAGSIEPGKYWYDSKAGFWGVTGHRCLGIIPPYIKEFSSRLQEKCSGGDTTVYVNGRELHKKDLNILECRRLPATRNKRYTVDISGKVLDEGTKKFVVDLGKLAPTVERKRRGFGMQVPDHLLHNF